MLDLIRYKNKPAEDLRLLVFESKNLREQLLAAYSITVELLEHSDMAIIFDEDGEPRWRQVTRLDDVFEQLDAQAADYLPDNVIPFHGRAA